MAILPIYTYGTKVLRKKARAVKHVDDEILSLIVNMFDTMRNANGIGLASTQVGQLNRVITVDISDPEEQNEFKPITLINPEVVSAEGLWMMEEGCLSIPDVRDAVDRPELVTVKFHDANFKENEIEVVGLLARVILHEIDHLNGVLFLDHLTAEQKQVHSETLNKIQRGEMNVDYPVISADSEMK
jgi:peptide deformylase